ncbi:MAG: aldo/keto reductase [Gammaproteobacteria bacterium]|nr:aldo/keto reductase [Gammaproteobacteria bacterium]
METRQLGPFEVSAIGLGCMNITHGYGPGDKDEAEAVLAGALDAGYTFFDTAAVYGFGESEKMMGKVLKPHRSEFVLATKAGLSKGPDGKGEKNGRPEKIRELCEQSLKNLQTDVIDLYYLHRVDPNVPIEDSIGAMSRLVEEGKVQTIGASELASDTLRRAHAVHPITAVQSEYSLWTRVPERKILDVCEELGIAFVPFSPLTRGYLTGKHSDTSVMADRDLRKNMPRFNAENYPENLNLLPAYNEIAARIGCTPAQLALAWVLARRDRTLIPIPGTKRVEWMKENALAVEFVLDEHTVNELDILINESTVRGERYSAQQMATTDSERD